MNSSKKNDVRMWRKWRRSRAASGIPGNLTKLLPRNQQALLALEAPSDRVTVHHNYETKQFFFSTRHCQQHQPGFVSVTAYLPEFCGDQYLQSAADLVKQSYPGETEIRNPHPQFQAYL